MRSTSLVFGALLLLAGCELVGRADEPLVYSEIEDIHYTEHVQPLLDRRCGACHGGAGAAAGLRLDAWAHVVAGSRFGEVVIPFDAGRSLLVEMATKLRGGPHPKEVGADTLTQDEVDFLARWIDEGARGDAGQVPYEGVDPARLLYVAGQGAAVVSVVDMQTNLVVRTVDLQAHGFSANARPHHVAVEPDGSAWYVSLIGDGRIAKFDRENRLVGTATMETPGMLAVDPARDLLFAGRSMTAVNPPSSLGFVRRSDLAVEEVPVVFPRPHALALGPDGHHVYTASLAQNRLVAVDVETGDATFTPVEVDGGMHGGMGGMAATFVQFALAPDGRRLYLTGEMTDRVHVFDLTDPAQPALLPSVAVGARPWHPVFTPDGRFLYVPNKGDHDVSVIDAATQAVVAVVRGDGLAEPHGSAVRPDGRYVYVSNNNTRGTYAPRHDLGDNAAAGTVVVIDTATRTVVKVLEVEANATGIGRAGR